MFPLCDAEAVRGAGNRAVDALTALCLPVFEKSEGCGRRLRRESAGAGGAAGGRDSLLEYSRSRDDALFSLSTNAGRTRARIVDIRSTFRSDSPPKGTGVLGLDPLSFKNEGDSLPGRPVSPNKPLSFDPSVQSRSSTSSSASASATRSFRLIKEQGNEKERKREGRTNTKKK